MTMSDKEFNDQIKLARLLKGGLLSHLNDDTSILNKALFISDKCKTSHRKDTKTNYIFKSFCLYGNMADCLKKCCYDNKTISNTLLYKQCDDIDITLLAKTLYYISGTKYKDFLEWQIKIILEYGKINIKEEYKRWLLTIYHSYDIDVDIELKSIDFD